MNFPVPLFPLRAVLPKAYSSVLKLWGKKDKITCRPPLISNKLVVSKSVPLPAILVAITISPVFIILSFSFKSIYALSYIFILIF